MRIFFGAGRIGKRAYNLCKHFGIEPDYFVDNSKELIGKTYCGIRIIALSEIYDPKKADILITCKNVEEITKQLHEAGVENSSILVGDSECAIMGYLCRLPIDQLRFHTNGIATAKTEKKVFFDLNNGLVLGGVETWSFQMANKLRKKGYDVSFITNNLTAPEIKVDGIDIIELQDMALEHDKIQKCIDTIYNYLPCTVISNFAQWIFAAACMVKKQGRRDINIIAIIHNDDDAYYNSYVQLKDYIDLCVAISSRTRKKLIERGFPESKTELLQWDVPVKKHLHRFYSELVKPVRIGYAGRLVTTAKRVDLLVKVADLLEQKGCNYILEIAGSGSYEENMRQQIQSKNLQHRVILSGLLKQEQIPEFWERQDVMITCSEKEGHSISQVEAMASGAVPVITDTSGARDDVDDGYNGYVVGVGRIEEIVDKILYLSAHREKLTQMGKNAYETIKMRSGQPDLIEEFLEMQAR